MQEHTLRVRPKPTERYLGNPHKGCCTFQGFNGDPLFAGVHWSEEGPLAFPPAQDAVAPGYLPSTVAYCRWFWRVMEPQQGAFDFSMVESALRTSRERGQTLAVRLMAFGSFGQPQVPDWVSQQCPMAQTKYGGGEVSHPVHDSPEYLALWGGLVKEFARRFDGHPDLETIDITYIGPWGEGAGECSAEQCRRFAEIWREAFPNTIRLGMIEGEQMRAAIRTGSGWRCDCFGDLRARGTIHVPGALAWNHMYDAYPEQVIDGGAQETWKTAPVHLETCWVPMGWYRDGYDIDFILEQGRKYHASYFMPKSTALPEPWMEKLAAFCRMIGYRFVIRQATVSSAGNSRAIRFTAWIENVGIAPLYRPYHFAIRLRQDEQESLYALNNVDVRTWLPGDAIISHRLEAPHSFRSGWVDIAAAIVRPGSAEPVVRFAVEEQFSDGWVPLGGCEIGS